jgi:hypothetical protein
MATATPYGWSPSNQTDTYSGKFTDPMEEEMFQSWYGYHAKKRGLNPDPDDGGHFYDYRAAYKAGINPDETGHWSSEFKLAGHPNLIVQSDVPGQLVNTKTGERFWNPQYHDVPFEQLFDLSERPKLARPKR